MDVHGPDAASRAGQAHLEGDVDATRFTETSAQSVIESLPFMLDEEAARGADVTFEIRLTGAGGGVWTV
ncbi:MAG TPA: hypothetical protein VNF72_06870, partial [Myxococcota bacterium]|nr:hypothetical protein [Myxococcota bacterium]